MAEKTNTEILHEMAMGNMDLKLSTTMVGGSSNRQGGIIEMGVDRENFKQACLHPEKYLFFLYIVNADEYFAVGEKE